MEKEALKYYNTYLQQLYRYMGRTSTWTSTLSRTARYVLGSRFKGVYPSDKIPMLDVRKSYIIVNVDKHNQPGSHWLAMAWRQGKLYVYDSYGRYSQQLISDAWKPNMIDADHDAEENKRQNDCGQRCIAWLMVFDQLGPGYALKI